MSVATHDIRAVLIQTETSRLLLPNATISEVLSYAEPEPVADAPDWLLGRIRWRGWRLPLLAFAQFTGQGVEQRGLGSKVVVLKSLGGEASLPFFALLTKGFPRLVSVSRDALADAGEAEAEAVQGVRAYVRLNDEVVAIPDIDGIERAILQATVA